MIFPVDIQITVNTWQLHTSKIYETLFMECILLRDWTNWLIIWHLTQHREIYSLSVCFIRNHDMFRPFYFWSSSGDINVYNKDCWIALRHSLSDTVLVKRPWTHSRQRTHPIAFLTIDHSDRIVHSSFTPENSQPTHQHHFIIFIVLQIYFIYS
jgi:hypothetical protein